MCKPLRKAQIFYMTYISLIWKQAILYLVKRMKFGKGERGTLEVIAIKSWKNYEDKCKELVVEAFTISSASLITTENPKILL